MDLLKKIEELKQRIDKFEQLAEDLNENILSKQKKIDYLKKQIHKNVNEIDEIIKDYMPTLKTEILGSPIEINYQESEKDKLIKIIEKFNHRLLDFENLRGKISDKKILILAALKAEDQIIDRSLTKEKETEIINNKKKEININDITQEIIQLKDIESKLSDENSKLKNLISKAFSELDKMEKNIIDLTDKIISQSND